MAQLPIKAWICPICGYIHYSSEPPEECPVCGTTADVFEPYLQVDDSPVTSEQKEIGKVVIVGAGIAGVSAAESLHKASPQVEVILISNEAHLPYYRLNLTRYLAGEVGIDQLTLHPEGWCNENNITLLKNTEVSSVDLAKKELIYKDENRMNYDQLILTIGAHPFLPPFSGVHKQNVTTLRTREDADFILEACRSNLNCVCIGGGLLGLETAGALARRGIDVTVVENQSWLLPRQLNQTAGMLFQEHVQSMGIKLRTNTKTRELAGDECVRGVLLEDGTTLPAQLVVVSAGVRSNVGLARQAGLTVNQGILVDNNMRTSHPEVFAAGDVAEYRGVIYGIWGPSQVQGSIAGLNAAGQHAEFNSIPRSNTLKVLGDNLFSIGQIAPKDSMDQVIETELDGKYSCYIFNNNRMVGSILLGDIALSGKIRKTIEEQHDCATLLQKKPTGIDVLRFIEDI